MLLVFEIEHASFVCYYGLVVCVVRFGFCIGSCNVVLVVFLLTRSFLSCLGFTVVVAFGFPLLSELLDVKARQFLNITRPDGFPMSPCLSATMVSVFWGVVQ